MVNAREAISCLVSGCPWRSATMGKSRASMEVGKLHCLPCGTAKVDKLHSSNSIAGSADDNVGWANVENVSTPPYYAHVSVRL
jgi:hypothetical protein